MIEDNIWVSKYKPKKIEDCILPERLKKIFQEYVDGKSLQHLILYGKSGIGKTTVAMALCEELGCDYIKINGSDDNGIDTFRTTIKDYASSISLSGGKKVIIIDEADYLNPNSIQPALRGGIEEFSDNCIFIFTCNYKSKIIDAIQSRCPPIEFSIKTDEKALIGKQFFKRATEILKLENVEYDDKVVIEIIKKYFPDFRRTLNELQYLSKSGKIDISALTNITNSDVAKLIEFIRDKNFTEIRKWVAINQVDSDSIFRQIYDGLYDIMVQSSIPGAVVILAEYQYKNAFCNDKEINLVACLTELMLSCELK